MSNVLVCDKAKDNGASLALNPEEAIMKKCQTLRNRNIRRTLTQSLVRLCAFLFVVVYFPSKPLAS